jgi:heterodisulfide reductase subunit D
MPKTQVSLDVTRIENFVFDMSRCVKCKGCTWVDHVYMPGVRYSTRCPSATRYLFDSYGAYGKMRIGLGLVEGRLDYSDELLKILYACTLCGACDVGCKRNLDLEIELTLEALRVKAVRDGKGPMPAHRKAARNIIEKHNSLGAAHKNRMGWITDGIQPSPRADVLYFVGCAASYTHPEIARATAKILQASGTPFMLLADEWCCGNTLYSVGMIDEARELAQRNVEAVRQTGAKTLLVSCAEGYRMWKVDYPKMLGISTADLGFEVVHLVEYVAESIRKGALKLTNRVDLRLTYHDPCSLSRLSEPWVPWKGERGLWGVVSPPLERRRGTHGVYEAPRDVLKLIPGVELVEMPRMRENAFCCGAGRGTREAFPEFAAWAADERLTEVGEVGAEALVSACPWCKDNFAQSVSRKQGNLKVFDFSELVLSAIGREG